MPFGQGDRCVTRERAEDREPYPVDAVLDKPAMTVACHLIENHTRDGDARIVSRTAERDGGGGLRLSRHVQHQQHRPAEARRHIGAGPCSSRFGSDAVEQSHRPFRNDEVGAGCCALSQRMEQAIVHGEAVEVQAHFARGRRMEGGVDIIGSAFGSADPQAAAAQGTLKAERHRCLA